MGSLEKRRQCCTKASKSCHEGDMRRTSALLSIILLLNFTYLPWVWPCPGVQLLDGSVVAADGLAAPSAPGRAPALPPPWPRNASGHLNCLGGLGSIRPAAWSVLGPARQRQRAPMGCPPMARASAQRDVCEQKGPICSRFLSKGAYLLYSYRTDTPLLRRVERRSDLVAGARVDTGATLSGSRG